MYSWRASLTVCRFVRCPPTLRASVSRRSSRLRFVGRTHLQATHDPTHASRDQAWSPPLAGPPAPATYFCETCRSLRSSGESWHPSKAVACLPVHPEEVRDEKVQPHARAPPGPG